MPTVADILKLIESIAPARWAMPIDKIGLAVGTRNVDVTGIAVSLDWSDGLIDFAERHNCNLLLCHHPIFWDPCHSMSEQSRSGEFAYEVARRGWAAIAAHTNWDAAPGGINDALAGLLGLHQVRRFGYGASVEMCKLAVYVQSDSVEAVYDALTKAGAGKIGDYDGCATSMEVTGRFIGNEQSQPAVGERGKKESVPEVCLQMKIRQDQKWEMERLIRAIHPYEEPAFDFFSLGSEVEMPMGRIGTLESPMSLREFQSFVNEKLQTVSWAWGDPSHVIRTVALVGGAADGDWRNAKREGADVYLTGEVKQNVAVEATEARMPIIAAGHYATEQPGMKALASLLQSAGYSAHVYEPQGGLSGRPNR